MVSLEQTVLYTFIDAVIQLKKNSFRVLICDKQRVDSSLINEIGKRNTTHKIPLFDVLWLKTHLKPVSLWECVCVQNDVWAHYIFEEKKIIIFLS